ncbi:hypothetical protein I7I51_02150 [Histoplasma capsulatum]|uniref:Uncharacterized protein n=1 Tax=Ajellomyces capsulatus TaxID=5037 RepID=A0A8A1MCG7_AJECA|nr:hypothetical protein I7I51_02150 [Histoplasma capsulatum]
MIVRVRLCNIQAEFDHQGLLIGCGKHLQYTQEYIYKYWYVYPSTSSKTLRERSALAKAFVLVLHDVNKGLPHFPWRRFPVVVSTSRKLVRPLVTDGYSGIRTRPSPQRFALYKTAMVRPEGTEPDT